MHYIRAFIVIAFTLFVLSACMGSASSDSEVRPLSASEQLVPVDTIAIQETDNDFIGTFESVGVSIDPFRLYVADRKLHRVAVVDGESGEIVQLIGEYGEGPGEFDTPERAIRVEDRILVVDTQSQLSVFDHDGTFIERNRLPEGIWRGGRWSLSAYGDDLYMAILDVEPRSAGLKASPDQDVIARIDSKASIIDRFGSYPQMYQEGEYVWQFTTLDVNQGLAAVGYYLSPEVQIYDIQRSDYPLVDTVSIEHPKFWKPEVELPMDMIRSELIEQAVKMSFVWHTFLLDESTIVQVFNNRTEEFYDDLSEEERHHYATLAHIDSGEQEHLELPGRIFARDKEGRLYIELNHVPDQRKIGVYEVVGWDD